MVTATKKKAKKIVKPKAVKAIKKAARKRAEVEVHEEKAKAFEGQYFYAVGRRKEAVAQVRLFPNQPAGGAISINGKPVVDYFPIFELQKIVLEPLKAAGQEGKIGVSVKVAGGGIRGQAEATRLGISRALVLWDASLRAQLKARGFLKRDARVKERKKYGLKGARRAPQWQKR